LIVSGRVKPPRCPSCGRPLYKKLDAAGERISSYAYCRNGECDCYGDIRERGWNAEENEKWWSDKRAGKDVKALVNSEPTKDTNTRAKRKRRAVPRRKDVPKSLCEKRGKVKCECEPESIALTREKLSGAFEDVTAKSISAVSVAVVLQEMGDGDVAEILIDRYKLDVVYGLKRSRK